MKNVAVLTEDGAFALFFHPHPGGFDSSRVPTLEGIDWCIIPDTSNKKPIFLEHKRESLTSCRWHIIIYMNRVNTRRGRGK